jgi:tartrate dehydrogenase/decarboxylase/D-malate dehydrogenase
MEDSVVLMLEFLYQPDASQAPMGAIEAVTTEGRVLTPDPGLQAHTPEFADAVPEKMAWK